MKRVCSSLFALAAVLLAVPSQAEVVNRVVARVNDRIATLYDYETRFQDGLARIRELPADPVERGEFLAQHARDTMKAVFEELLVLSRADQLGVFVSDTEVDDALIDMREQNDLQNNDQFRAALAASGIIYEDLLEQYRTQLMFQRVMGREVYSQIDISEEDLRRYYRENEDEFREPERRQIREIVVLDATGSDSAAAELASVVVGALRAGRSFEDVAADYDDETVSSVIDVGWVTPGDLDPKLEEAVWALEVGAYGDPVTAPGGLHVARLIALEASVVKPFKDVEDAIHQQQRMAATEDRIAGYLVDLEETSYLFLDPPEAAAGFRTATGETPLSAEFPILDADPGSAGAGDPSDP